MRPGLDPGPALRSWLRDVPPLPDRVLSEALDRAAVTPQRRHRWLPTFPMMGPRTMLSAMRLATAAVFVAFVGGFLLSGFLSEPEELPTGPAIESPSPSPPLERAIPAPSTPLASREIVVAEDGSGDLSTIAEAVELATDGDTILVRAGTYIGGVTVEKDITIKGDGVREDIVVVATDETPTIDVEGFVAYAFLLQDTDATIADLTLRNDGATADFGPIVAAGGAPTLRGLDAAGTIWLTDGSDAVVRDNIIGGLSMVGGLGSPTIGDNVTTDPRRDLEDALLERLAPATCDRWREDDEPFDHGAHAAVRCAEPERGVGQLALFTFPDPGSLDRFWQWRMDGLGLGTLETEAACGDGREGIATWEHGSVACYVPDGGAAVARIRWTDDRTNTYGVIDANDRDYAALYDRWLSYRNP